MLNLAHKPARPLVAASILSADFARIGEECRDVLGKGADLLHVDVMDGHFVPNLTLGADMVRALRKHLPDSFLDVHLMVERPDAFAEMFVHAGANNITFHYEVTSALRGGSGVDAQGLIDRIHALGARAGMAINPPTAADGMDRFFDGLDMVLVMSVNPGRSGQRFIPEVLDKARWVKARIKDHTRLEMDGGVNPATAGPVVAAGVDVMVTASALFGAEDRSAVIRQLHEA